MGAFRNFIANYPINECFTIAEKGMLLFMRLFVCTGSYFMFYIDLLAMNFFSPFPFLRFTLALIVGIVCYYYYPYISSSFLIAALVGLLILYAMLSVIKRPSLMSIAQGITAILWLLLLGYTLAYFKTEHNSPYSFTKNVDNISYAEVKVATLPEEKTSVWKTIATVDKIWIAGKSQLSKGRVLLYLQREKLAKPKVGDILLIKNAPTLIEAPKNPFEFDYQQYMRFQNVEYQYFLNEINVVKKGYQQPFWLISWAITINQRADEILTKYIQHKTAYGVANAMILGLRDDLDNNLIQAYSAAGAIHVLSVSGLHVGVIYGVLYALLAFLRRRNQPFSNALFVIIILSLLWFYAFVTGLSSPVLRSTLMFSIFLIADVWKKDQNAYNTVAFSAFMLLLWNPYFVFNVGFQLSYLAVFGMIYFQPLLNPIIIIDKKKNWVYWLLDRLWKVTTVAVAAQIATLPITIYYFHQFPNYFLFANPVVILLSSIVLCVGLGFVAVTNLLLWLNFPKVVALLGMVLRWTIDLLNGSVLLVEKLPFAITKFLYLHTWEMWIMYLIIFTIIALIETQRIQWIYVTIVCLGLLISSNVVDFLKHRQQQQLSILSVPKHTVITIVEGKKAYLLANTDFLKSRSNISFRLTNYWSSLGITDTLSIDLQQDKINKSPFAMTHLGANTFLAWHGKTFLILRESLKNKSIKLFHHNVDYLILANKSVKNLEEIQNNISYTHLIIDGSYTDWYADKLSTNARELGIICANLRDEKALILK